MIDVHDEPTAAKSLRHACMRARIVRYEPGLQQRDAPLGNFCLPHVGSIFNNFSGHADGERRGLDRVVG